MIWFLRFCDKIYFVREGEDTFIKAEIIIMIDDEVFWHANRRKKMIGKLAPPPNWPLDNNKAKVSLVTEYSADHDLIKHTLTLTTAISWESFSFSWTVTT